MHVSAEQVRWFRFQRSGLAQPMASPEAVTTALIGVQAQILTAAGLALWQRTTGLDQAAYDAALHETRRLVKLWGMRSTLHLFTSQEWPLIYAATWQEGSTYYERQVRKNGGDIEAFYTAIHYVTRLLQQRHTLTRSDLRAAEIQLSDELLSAWGGIFSELVHRGLACHAGQNGGEGVFAWREYWLPDLEWDPPSFEAANVAVLRRYFHTYGPAAEVDFRFWRLVPAAASRRWLSAVQPELAAVTVAGQSMLLPRADLAELAEPAPPAEAWPVKLLYRFDPLLLAHKDKTWLVDASQYKQVWRAAGHIEGTILVHGRIAGTWRYQRQGAALDVQLAPFAPLPAFTRPAIESQLEGIAAFFGLSLRDVRWQAEGGN